MTTVTDPLPPQTVTFTSLVPGIDVLHVGQSRDLWRVYHDTYCIALVEGGAGSWKYRGRHHEIRPNTLMLSEPGEVHTTTAVESPGSFTSLFIAAWFIELQFGSELPGPLHFRVAQTTTSPLWQQVAGNLRSLTHRYAASENSDLSTEHLLLALRGLFEHTAQEKARNARPCPTRVRRARDAIIDNYRTSPGERLNIASLAKDLDVSRYWLTNMFKREFGCAPSELHTLLRVARVKQLVAAGGKSLNTIARESGYCDQSQMTREFRAHWRMTPGQLQHLIDSSL